MANGITSTESVVKVMKGMLEIGHMVTLVKDKQKVQITTDGITTFGFEMPKFDLNIDLNQTLGDVLNGTINALKNAGEKKNTKNVKPEKVLEIAEGFIEMGFVLKF